MEFEHCQSRDSLDEFEVKNYGTKTCVISPDLPISDHTSPNLPHRPFYLPKSPPPPILPP